MLARVRAVAVQARHLTDEQANLSFGDQRAHLLDRMRRGAEIVAAMDQRQRFGEGLQVERPVEGAVAAADNHDVAPAHALRLAHRVENGMAFIALDALERRPLGRERPAACRNDHDLRQEDGAGIARQAKAPVGLANESVDTLGKVKVRPERLDLFHQPVGQFLTADDGEAGNVIDRFFRIEFGALAARAVEDVDDVRLDVEQSEFEHGEKPARARADDHAIGFDHV